jgi:small subunit ribosomal protein S18
MATLQQSASGKKTEISDILRLLNIETNKSIVVSKNLVLNIDYKDGDFLLKFVNEQGKILRRLTGTSLKFQRKVSVAVKTRHLALMPYVADLLK